MSLVFTQSLAASASAGPGGKFSSSGPESRVLRLVRQAQEERIQRARDARVAFRLAKGSGGKDGGKGKMARNPGHITGLQEMRFLEPLSLKPLPMLLLRRRALLTSTDY